MTLTTRITKNKSIPKYSKLFLIGFIGILFNIPLMFRFLQGLEETAPVSLSVLVSVSLVQSAVLLLVAVMVGAFLVPRLGMSSHLVQLNNKDSFSKELPYSLLAGLVTAVIALMLEAFFSVFIGAELEQLNQAVPRDALTTLAGIFYGGLTEEILVRWGLLSFVAFVFWKLFNRKLAKPGASVMWGSIILVAVIFGIGHLGAVGVLTTLTPLLIIRTITLNAVIAIAFGWLFWRKSLESAMVAHMSWHLCITVISLIVPFI